MNNELVSIIVPIYNVEKYIRNGIESLLNQSYTNIEIILVDDGSPDNCPSICDEYAKKYDRVKVIHKKNGGVSSARNCGLDIAKGKYVTFVDGDDYVDTEYVSYLLDIIKKNNSDVGVNTIHYSNSNIKTVDESIKCESSECIIEKIYNGKVDVAVWNKIYSKDFLLNNNIRFNEDIWYGEGMLFNIECLQYTDKVGIGKKYLYHQVFNTESAMRKFNLKSQYCGLKSLDIQKSIWKKKNTYIENAWIFHKKCFNMSILKGLLKSKQYNEYKEEYKKCKRNMKKDIFFAFRVRISLKRKIYYLLASIFPNVVARYSVKKELKKY